MLTETSKSFVDAVAAAAAAAAGRPDTYSSVVR